MTRPVDMPGKRMGRAGGGPLATTASIASGRDLDAERIHGMAMVLVNALGRRRALERCHLQEREAASTNAVARAVREEVERFCSPLEAAGAGMGVTPASLADREKSEGECGR